MCSPETGEVGEGDDSPAPADHAEQVISDPTPMGAAPNATTLTIEGPKGSFSLMPVRASAEPIAPRAVPPQRAILDGRSACAPSPRSRGEGAEAAEGTEVPPAAPSPISEPPATLSAKPETNGISPDWVTARDDDIFREGEADLPLASAPQLGVPPQRPVGEAQAAARPSSDIAEYLFADVMALSEEERLALFT
jgi:hypothetical protein